jgi:catechol 2,3-dioxygenase-like lactoylglutathione lyase family enzyme
MIGGVDAPKLDHVVIHVSDWERSNAFYGDVLGAELIELPRGRWAYGFGDVRLNVHGPGPTSACAWGARWRMRSLLEFISYD